MISVNYFLGMAFNILLCWVLITIFATKTNCLDFAFVKDLSGKITGIRLTPIGIMHYILIFSILFATSWVGTFVVMMILVSATFLFLVSRYLKTIDKKPPALPNYNDFPY